MKKQPFTLLILFLLVGGMACSQSTMTYEGPSFTLEYENTNSELKPYADLLKESGVFEEVMADLDVLFNLPAPVRIIFTAGKPGPQYYRGVINMPYEFMMYNDQLQQAAQYSDNREEQLDLLFDLTEFVLYHEVGHALVDMLDIPVLGKEEDAVDGFAAVLAATMELEEVALGAADIFDMGLQFADKEISDEEFWGEHSLDEQRMFTIFCLIYGSNPEEHPKLLDEVGMPAEMRNECQRNYQETLRNWSRVLGDYLRN